MTFLLYDVRKDKQKTVLSFTGDEYKLATLLRGAWEENASPLNKGWHASANDLIRLHSKGASTYANKRLLVDFHPSAKRRIGIIEILDVYGYTFGDASAVWWTPIMLRLKDIYYEVDFDPELDETGKKR